MTDPLNRALIDAAWDNDLPEAERLIEQGADVNARDETVQSAYLIATSEGYVDLLRLTLAHGADLAAKDSYNGTGLIRAADRGHAEVVAILLQAGIEVDHINNLGWTALHEGIILGTGEDRYVDCVRLLLAYGGDPALPSQQDGISPLTHAESRGFDTIATTIRRVLDHDHVSGTTGSLANAVAAGDADGMVLALRALRSPAEITRAVDDVSAPAGSDENARLLTLLHTAQD